MMDQFDPQPGIEWMLQSSQVSEASLTEALGREFAGDLARLAQAVLTDTDAAQTVVRATLAEAVYHRHRYWGDPPLRAWVFALAMPHLRRAIQRTRRPGLARGQAAQSAGPADPALAPLGHLGSTERLALLLRGLLDFSVPEIAGALGLKEAGVARALAQARLKMLASSRWERMWGYRKTPHPVYQAWLHDRLNGSLGKDAEAELEQHLATCPACRSAEEGLTAQEARLKAALRARWPAVPGEAGLADALQDHILGAVNQRWAWNRYAFSVREIITLIPVLALVLLGLGWASTRWLAGDPPNPTPLPVTVIVYRQITVTPVPTPTPAPTRPPAVLPPLSAASTDYEIRLRMEQGSQSWQTLWADVRFIDYGPAGYSGPAWVYRNQVWVERPDNLMVIGGPWNGDPDYLRIKQGNQIQEYNLASGVVFSNTWAPVYDPTGNSAQLPVVFPNIQPLWTGARQAPFGMLSGQMLFPQDYIWSADTFRVVGETEYMGSPALLVDELTWDASQVSRLWIDPEQGTILNWVSYDRRDPTRVSYELSVVLMGQDAVFPEGMLADMAALTGLRWESFNPPPLPLPLPPTRHNLNPAPPVGRLPPPDDYDLPGSWLTFAVTGTGQTGAPLTEVFAGRYLLGTLDIGDPRQAICERSADGRYIAMITGPDQPRYPAASLRWYDLINFDEGHMPLPEGSTIGSDVAFSPDSRRMAYWGCGGRESNCGVYLLDLETGQNIKLRVSDYTGYFTWSPDGQQLAMVGIDLVASSFRLELKLMLVDVNSAEMVYTERLAWETALPSVHAPTNSWGYNPFPPIRDLDGCTYPPGY